MGAENFVKAATAVGQRGSKRARVLLTAKLETRHGEIDARLRDLSRRGALVQCAKALAPAMGSEVVFVRGSTRVEARVAWAAEGRIGLEFDHPIDEHDLFVHLGRKDGVIEPSRNPILWAPMNPTDRRIAQAWSVAVGLNLPEQEP